MFVRSAPFRSHEQKTVLKYFLSYVPPHTCLCEQVTHAGGVGTQDPLIYDVAPPSKIICGATDGFFCRVRSIPLHLIFIVRVFCSAKRFFAGLSVPNKSRTDKPTKAL